MNRGTLALAVIAFAVPAAAAAEILEWRDASGARHFTNSRQGVPAEFQSAARVLIADWARPPAAPAPAVAALEPPAPPAPPAVPRQAQIATDRPAFDEAYLAGVEAGMIAGGGGGGGGAANGGSVQIYGPLAVASAHTTEDVGGYPFVPFGWDAPGYYPFVTTSFDRGRSRHQTLRMLLQDQFQLDRDGPYAYDRWNQPGLGPRLAPFLSRGLPYGMQQGGRVIYR
ncbi:MAG: hypothetical protein ACRERC_19710 [Candidatus Binatia bacterium]